MNNKLLTSAVAIAVLEPWPTAANAALNSGRAPIIKPRTNAATDVICKSTGAAGPTAAFAASTPT